MLQEPRPKSKAKQVVPIPADLREFLQEVLQLIEAGDEAAIHESDDMLQAEAIYGGLIEEDGTCYGFTYFSNEYADTKFGNDAKWELLLETSEITEIVTGTKSELTLWACQAPLCGNKFSDPSDLCFDHNSADSATV